MAEAALELRTILEAAERDAAAQDFVSAERHLRQAAVLQEAQLGPAHHDLANTLNNLGIVCEQVGKSADAEACYRRAYRIARTSLPADHPLVQTSGQNLRDFCAAMGKPFDPPEPQPSPALDTFASESAAAKAAAAAQSAPRPQPVPIAAPVAPAPAKPVPVTPAPAKPTPVAPVAAAAPAKPPAPVAPSRPSRPTEVRAPEPPARPPTAATRTASPVSAPSSRPIVPIAIGAVLLVAVATWWFAFRGPAAPREKTAPPVASAAPETPAPAPIEQPPIADAPAPETPAPKDPPPPVKAAASGDVSVADAKVCRPLSTSNWTCTPATSPAAPGVFFFYTRVKSPRDTTVQHRWLMNGRLVRSVSLRVAANPGAGYRTYSRNTVGAERRGDWTLELRDTAGALLHEERFTVQ